MATKKAPFDSQGKQLSHALYNLNLGSQTKDSVLSKSNISTNRSPASKPSLTRVYLGNSPNKNAEEPSREVKTKSPLSSNKPEVRGLKSPSRKVSNEQQKKLSRPQSSKSTDVEKESIQNKTLHQNSTDVYPKATEDISVSNNINDENMAECKICGRKFLTDRLNAHEKACNKLNSKKRKIFVARKLAEGQHPVKNKTKSAGQPKPKSNWRKTHEEFVANIRAARQAQKILDAGGSLADLPPPPPLDTSHLTPCPHCGRKFSETAAARHIPLCKEKALRAKVAAPRVGGRGSVGSSGRGGTSRISGTKRS